MKFLFEGLVSGFEGSFMVLKMSLYLFFHMEGKSSNCIWLWGDLKFLKVFNFPAWRKS